MIIEYYNNIFIYIYIAHSYHSICYTGALRGGYVGHTQDSKHVGEYTGASEGRSGQANWRCI